MKKNLLAAILGAVIFFVWSAVVHMNPGTAMLGLSQLNGQEDVVMTSLKAEVPSPGLYFFPAMDMSGHATKEQQDAWAAKYKAGPSGLLLVQPPGGNPMMMGKQLVIQFLSNLLCALIAAFILTSGTGSFLRRLATVTALGLFSWLAISVAQWNWYEFPFAFIALDAINQIIGWLLAGLLMAAMIKPANQSAPLDQSKIN
jgi:hypothetical protein